MRGVVCEASVNGNNLNVRHHNSPAVGIGLPRRLTPPLATSLGGPAKDSPEALGPSVLPGVEYVNR